MQCLPLTGILIFALTCPVDYHSVEKNRKLGCEGFRTETVTIQLLLSTQRQWSLNNTGPSHTSSELKTDCSLTLACSWGRARRQLFWFTYIVHIHMKLPLWVSPQSLVCVPPAGWSFGQMCWITKADADRVCEIHRRWDELAVQRQGRNSEALILFPGSAHSTVHTNAIFKNLCW